MKIVLALSGGMDSTTLLDEAMEQGHEVEAVHFQYGSKHNPYERKAINELLRLYNVRMTEFALSHILGNFKSALLVSDDRNLPHGHYEEKSMSLTVVPGRNLIFTSIMAGFAWSIGARQVWLGIHAGDHAIYPDCRASFFNAMNEAVKLGTDNNVEMDAPFLHMTKKDILRRGLELCVPYGRTRTCYAPQPISCGRCGSCQERLEAFKLNGVEDPLEYETRELMPKNA